MQIFTVQTLKSEVMKMIEVIKAEDIPNLGDYDIDIYNAIIVPRNATNGDMLLSMFDTATVYGIDKENDYITICIDNNFYQKFRYSWWNVTYKRGNLDGSN